MRYRSGEMDATATDEIIEESGKLSIEKKDDEKEMVSEDILNPFVHHLELDNTYDILKVSF